MTPRSGAAAGLNPLFRRGLFPLTWCGLWSGLLLAAAAVVPGLPAKPSPEELAGRCGEKVVLLKSGHARQPVVVSQEELNAYLEVHRERLFESAVKEVQVTLKEDVFLIRGVVNLGEAKIELKTMLQKAFLWILSGDHRFDADVHFQSSGGQGKYKVRSLAIDGIPFPEFMIEFLATEAGKRQTPPMQPDRLFPLPYNLERAKVQNGKATCYPAKAPTQAPADGLSPATPTPVK
jgi:hypothetical protein